MISLPLTHSPKNFPGVTMNFTLGSHILFIKNKKKQIHIGKLKNLCGAHYCNKVYLYLSFREGNGTPLQYSCLTSHGWRSLVGCSPRGHWGSDATEQLHFHFSLSCAGEGNGNPLQCVLAWRIPGTGKPDGLPSMGSHRVGHDWSDLAAAAA